MINIKVGELMRQIRKKHNVSMIELASSIKISQPRLSRIENGEQDIPISVINDFCNSFDIPLQSFIGGLNKEESNDTVIDDQLGKIITTLNDEQKNAMYTFLSSLRK
jgi:transcriptional regulator with XRE-family HTH domain